MLAKQYSLLLFVGVVLLTPLILLYFSSFLGDMEGARLYAKAALKLNIFGIVIGLTVIPIVLVTSFFA